MSDTSRPALGSEFDKFLFSALGEDQNGLPLSLVSLFARMNLDPWQEAGNLAALPTDAAARRLTCSLDSLTDPVLRQANTEKVVLRLLALLPRPTPAAVRAGVSAVGSIPSPEPAARIGAIVLITSVIVLLVSQIIAGHLQSPIPSGVVHTPPVLVPSQTLPTPADH